MTLLIVSFVIHFRILCARIFLMHFFLFFFLFHTQMLAVVYETFTTIEKEKIKKLILHKHKGSELAFNLLVSKDHSKQLRFKQFQGLMKYFAAEKCNYF